MHLSRPHPAGTHLELKADPSRKNAMRKSLVVCPQVLVGHWVYEVEKYVDINILKALAFEGPPSHRQQLETTDFMKADVIVMSYETLRADIQQMSQVHWIYCILDEGHLIRNPKAKISQVQISTFSSRESMTNT